MKYCPLIIVFVELLFLKTISEVQFAYFTYISVFILQLSAKVQHSQSVSEYKLDLSTVVFKNEKFD